MKLFYHVVGRENAAEDFPKTVFRHNPVDLVRESVPFEHPLRDAILSDLEQMFPDGEFNAWGVPAGAFPTIKDITPGDGLLLVETIAPNGQVPALGVIKVFWPIELPTVSQALWGSSRFPYIFFFETERLSLTWDVLRQILGYAETFRPRARVYSIGPPVLARWNGAVPLLEHLRGAYGPSPQPYPVSHRAYRSVVREPRARYGDPVVVQHREITANSQNPEPVLEERTEQVATFVTPRMAAFRSGIIDLYGGQCAVCSSGLRSPTGLLEVEGAHIYPKRLQGSDDWRNGICLCRKHHWAFDVGWFAISDDLRVIVRHDLPDDPEYSFVRDYAGKPVAVPHTMAFAPHPLFLQAQRRLFGFE